MEIRHFLKAFLANPIGVATIFPASEVLARIMAEQTDIKNRKTVVEIGVGTGALTSPMLDLMGPEHSYTGFEIDKSFYQFLNEKYLKQHKNKIGKTKHFEFKPDSATELSKFFAEGSVDAVVSSLPWAAFDLELQQTILDQVYKILKPGGVFTFYNYITASQFKKVKIFRKEVLKRFETLEPRKRVYLNFPPATFWMAQKKK